MNNEYIDYLKTEIERWIFRYIKVRALNKVLNKKNKALIIKVNDLKNQIDSLSSKQRLRQIKQLNKN